VVRAFEAERRNILATAKQMGRALSASERQRLARLFSERIERYLDAGFGACFVRDPRVARLVVSALRHFDGRRYRLLAWCVMPNHVHVVFEALTGRSLAEILQSWKSFTAKEANRVLRRSGDFWQREYYDHIVRNAVEFRRIVRYVIENPARAGFREWPWVGSVPTKAREPARRWPYKFEEESRPAPSAALGAGAGGTSYGV